MISPEKYAPTNFVPAVAVIRRGRVLSVMTGRKGRVGCMSVDWGTVTTGGEKNDSGKCKTVFTKHSLFLKIFAPGSHG